MSKQSLQQAAKLNSGVSYEESKVAIDLQGPSMYQRIGEEDGCRMLSELFYERVFDDTEAPWFLNIFSSSTKAEAIDNQVREDKNMYVF